MPESCCQIDQCVLVGGGRKHAFCVLVCLRGCHCDCCDVVVGGLCARVFLVVWDVLPIYFLNMNALILQSRSGLVIVVCAIVVSLLLFSLKLRLSIPMFAIAVSLRLFCDFHVLRLSIGSRVALSQELHCLRSQSVLFSFSQVR